MHIVPKKLSTNVNSTRLKTKSHLGITVVAMETYLSGMWLVPITSILRAKYDFNRNQDMTFIKVLL